MTKAEKDKPAMFIIAGVLAAAGLMGVFVWHVVSEPLPGKDNCLEPITASTIIVLDRSEGMSRQTIDEIKRRVLTHISEHVEINHELISMFTIEASSKDGLAPIGTPMCRPKSTGNGFDDNKSWIEANYKKNCIRSTNRVPVMNRWLLWAHCPRLQREMEGVDERDRRRSGRTAQGYDRPSIARR